jgi:predicted RNA binding protein YcfA (HicA-like mRNA interferase family)
LGVVLARDMVDRHDLLSRGDCRAARLFKALTEVGWHHDRISGSHHVFTRDGSSCLPVAVHGGKVRRDVAYHILRRACLPEAIVHETDDAVEPASLNLEEVVPALVPARSAAAEDRWAVASDNEREQLRAREEQAANELQRERGAFELLLQEAQRAILDGDYATVHEQLGPALGSGTEAALDSLIERIGYELIGDALFFFSTALGQLAVSEGEAGFGSVEQQQLILTAFAACKRLLERFREKRDEARALLRSLLSRVYSLYLGRLMDLAVSQLSEEFSAADLSNVLATLGDNADEPLSPMIGGLSDGLDQVNANILSSFNFIMALSRSEQELVMLATHEMGSMHQGLVAVARANIVHYERGNLQMAVQTFTSLLWLLEKEQASLDASDCLVPAELRAEIASSSLAVSTLLSTATTLRALAEACIKMHPAHEHAAAALLWSRAMGFSADQDTSRPMRDGWSAVLESSRERSAAVKPLKWKSLCEVMRLYFAGLEYSAAHCEELCTGTAARFIVDNLRDPVSMILHQCKQLEASSEPLRLAAAAHQRSLRAGSNPDPDDRVFEGLHARPLQAMRQQLVTMHRWLVQLHGLYHRLDAIIRFSIRCDPEGTCSHRFHDYHTAVSLVTKLFESCCVRLYQSTLLDVISITSRFSRFLDFFLHRDLCGNEIQSLQQHADLATQNGQLLLELKDCLPGFIKWFCTASERKKLAVRFGMMCTLMGFSLQVPDIAENMQQMRSGTHSGRFCVFAVEMVELLHQMGSQPVTREALAEMLVWDLSDHGVPGMDPSDRRATRSPEIQKKARTVYQLVASFQSKFPPAILAGLCKKRQLHLGAFDAIFDRMIEALRTAASGAPVNFSMQEGGSCVLVETITRLGELMPDWSPQDMHDINLHAIALAELASDINIRVQAVFGGNYPALVWLNDCYEFDPNNATKDMQLLNEHELHLFHSVQAIRRLFERGDLTQQPVEVEGIADPVTEEDGATAPREPVNASKRQGKKKHKGKGKR